MTPETRTPEETSTALLATALMSKRRDGHIATLSAEDAAALLGSINAYPTGQGGFNLLVPKLKTRDLDLNEDLWASASHLRRVDDTLAYDLDYMTGVELIARLEVVAGKKWQEMQTLKQSVDASRGERKIG